MAYYFSTRKTGIRTTRILGDAMDGAPHPYTATELAEVTGVPLDTVRGWLVRNTAAGRISSRRIARPDGTGKLLSEYWRGQEAIMDTWSVDEMTEDTSRQIDEGRRPVSWKDGTRTAWSVDELGTVTAMKGNSVVRFGQMERMERTEAGMRIVVKDGPVLTFKRRP